MAQGKLKFSVSTILVVMLSKIKYGLSTTQALTQLFTVCGAAC